MYPFKYHKAATVRGAVSLLKKAEDPKLLAGGHTLIPTMKQRLASPKTLIDLAGAGLSGIEQKGRTIVVGAMTTHADVANSPVVQAALPALASLAGNIGDPHVRHRGTIGGSLANNDPAADYPAAVLALGATVHTNKRKIAADEFFAGMFSTALDEDEIITKIAFPVPGKAAYVKFPNPASRYALVGVFVAKKGRAVRVAVTGAGSGGVFRHAAMEEALSKRFNAKALDGVATDAADLNGDIHASPEYRAHLVGVMAKRAVAAA
ncbi:xanthine dehydrogenase family protein subunit M [Phreatobacter aquaticus]|uniref:Xanthine dehydrogenase family protein subunit M n=1 Tax=Phreatobacter aquaticus TaxID=2570229 RepID=A0A4D7QK40_9HYPH|nr:xanthine dehydrogenase family protein subunit M [Phreatobacter aquaticus]QCK87978.1 xanthine dehydrogenase family protein subunit M [Phreatobacter aquaticus]